MGLVSEVFPTEDFHAKVTSLARQMTDKPLAALKAAKRAVRHSEDNTIREGIDMERSLFFSLMDTPGAQEGISAFV